MSEIVTIAYNAVNAILHKPSVAVKLEVQSALSYMVDGAEDSLAFKQSRWDGRNSFFDYTKCSFPAGFVHFVTEKLRSKGYQIKLARKPPPAPGPARPEVDSFGYDPKYDYQPEVADRLIRYGQMIAQIATGGGKSRVARICFARINRPTLFLTTRGILMYQMKDTFEKDLGVPCSVIGDGQFGEVNAKGQLSIRKMTVGMVQTLSQRLEETTFEKEFQTLYDAATKKHEKAAAALTKQLKNAGISPIKIRERIEKLSVEQEKELLAGGEAMKLKAEAKFKERTIQRQQTIKLLELFEFVILEEAHEASGNSYYEILRHCKNAHYRLSLTGTPFMRESQESNMRLMACSGSIGIKVSEKMLIERGILAKPYFKTVKLTTKPHYLHIATPWASAYRLGIVENEQRNRAIVLEALRGKIYGLSSMALVQHTAHGDTLLKLMGEAGLRAMYIRGEDDQTERKYALNALANGEIDVLIGTTILDVGVDVPAVGLIILAGGGKAEIALRQRIGRGLRAKKQGPNVALVVDFNDPFNKILREHAHQRLEIIKQTPGFAEGIVEDFNYEALGFKKVA